MSDENENLFDSPWGKLIGGAILLAAAYWCHHLFTEVESGVRESARINWIVALAYRTLGHLPTVGLLGFGGVFSIFFGLKQFGSE
jgi:hypothetical protein